MLTELRLGVAQKQLQKCLEKSPSQEGADPELLLRELQARWTPDSGPGRLSKRIVQC